MTLFIITVLQLSLNLKALDFVVGMKPICCEFQTFYLSCKRMPNGKKRDGGRRGEDLGLNVVDKQAECKLDMEDSCNEFVEFLWKREYN